MWLEDYGRYLIATDGAWIGCEEDAGTRDLQERFVFAQALPIAAVLHGYEVLHAGAVCGPGGAAAFLGPSGSGKTTVTGHLVLRGARFMTDDVLALGTSGGDAVAHPGPPFMAIRPQDAWIVGDEQVGRAIGASDKIHVARRVPNGPVPLRVIYYLARGPGCEIAPLDDDVRRVILGQAFVPYVTTPERLLRHLEIGQLINDRVEQFRLQTPARRPRLGDPRRHRGAPARAGYPVICGALNLTAGSARALDAFGRLERAAGSDELTRMARWRRGRRLGGDGAASGG